MSLLGSKNDVGMWFILIQAISSYSQTVKHLHLLFERYLSHVLVLVTVGCGFQQNNIPEENDEHLYNNNDDNIM